MNKKFVDEFVEKVLETKKTFDIIKQDEKKRQGAGTIYHFMQGNVGKARYIYGAYSFYEQHFYSSLRKKYDLYAIVSDNIVYLVEDFQFGIFNYDFKPEELPENVIRLSDYVKNVNQRIKDTMFTEFYNKLEIVENLAESNKKFCEKQARKWLLEEGSQEYSCGIEVDSFVNTQEIVDSICGFIDIEEKTKKFFEENKEDWVRAKSEKTQIKKLINAKSVIDNWEWRLAKGLRAVSAKTVNVEFEFNGNKAIGKMYPHKIINNLIKSSCFSTYDFVAVKQGKQIFDGLGADDSFYSKNGLNCGNINQITYGKKILYSKELGKDH